MSDEEKVSSLAKLVPNKSDQELADEFRDKILANANPLLDVLEAAHKHGFDISIGFGMNAFGKMVVGQLAIMRNYTKPR